MAPTEPMLVGSCAGVPTGFRVRVASALSGGSRAVRQGDVIYVSPAMYDLMSHADEAELERLLQAIRLVTLPPADRGPVTLFAGPD